MGSLGQDRASGTLVLEQNDGTRKLYWEDGKLVHLQSTVAGEQLGNYLLRQGILDFASLSELLANDEQFRLGEKVVQWGLMTVEERDLHLKSLQEQVMINALEHTIVDLDWQSGHLGQSLSEDLRFRIDHRNFIWSTFQEAHDIGELCDLLYAKKDWRWTAEPRLLEGLSDLPLTPQVAYTLALIGAEPVGFEMLLSLSGMDDEAGARFLLALWALGGIRLSQGEMPQVVNIPQAKAPEPVVPIPTVKIPPPAVNPPPTPSAALPPLPEPLMTIPLDFLPIDSRPEPTIELLAAEDMVEEVEQPVEAPRDTSATKARKYFLKAKSLLIQERTVEAIRLLEESVRLDPDSEQAYEPWLTLGKHRLANPAWSTRAVEALQAASRLKPKAGEPWALMGELYHRKGFKANANACFKKALELDPSVPVPADVDLKEGQVEEPKGILGRFKSILGRQEK